MITKNGIPVEVEYALNVTKFGTKGNGTDDDYNAINSAITALSGSGDLYFPKGTYRIASNLTVASGIRFVFEQGAMISVDGVAISAITKANPGEVTTSSTHGFSDGDKVRFKDVGGMTQLNYLTNGGIEYTVTVIDTTHFTIGVDTSGYTTYTSGGYAQHIFSISGTIDAGRSTIFTGNGSITLTNINEVLSDWFGVVSDGTDITTKLQWLIACYANRYPIIILGKGTFKVTAPLYIGSLRGLTLKGVQGISYNQIDSPTIIYCKTVTGYIFPFSNSFINCRGNLRFENIKFDGADGTGVGSTTCLGVIDTGCSNAYFSSNNVLSHCIFANFFSENAAALYFRDSGFSTVNQCFFKNIYGRAVRIGTAGQVSTTFSFNKCYFQTIREIIYINPNVLDVHFNDCVFESSTVAVVTHISKLFFTGCYFENIGMVIDGNTKGISLRGLGYYGGGILDTQVDCAITVMYGIVSFKSCYFVYLNVENIANVYAWVEGIGRAGTYHSSGNINFSSCRGGGGAGGQFISNISDADRGDFVITGEYGGLLADSNIRKFNYLLNQVSYENETHLTEVNRGHLTFGKDLQYAYSSAMQGGAAAVTTPPFLPDGFKTGDEVKASVVTFYHPSGSRCVFTLETSIKTNASTNDTNIDINSVTNVWAFDRITIVLNDGSLQHGRITAVVDSDTVTIYPAMTGYADVGNAVYISRWSEYYLNSPTPTRVLVPKSGSATFDISMASYSVMEIEVYQFSGVHILESFARVTAFIGGYGVSGVVQTLLSDKITVTVADSGSGACRLTMTNSDPTYDWNANIKIVNVYNTTI